MIIFLSAELDCAIKKKKSGTKWFKCYLNKSRIKLYIRKSCYILVYLSCNMIYLGYKYIKETGLPDICVSVRWSVITISPTQSFETRIGFIWKLYFWWTL